MAKQFNALTFDAEALKSHLIKKLHELESQETYTEDEESSRWGKIGIIEDLINEIEIGTFQKEE